MALLASLAIIAPGLATAAGTATIEGTVTADVGAAAIADVVVCAWPEDADAISDRLCVETDENGEYAVGELEEGQYRIEFWAEGNELDFIGEYFDDVRFWHEAELVAVEAGETVEGIDGALESPGRIEGTVTGASDELPLGEVEVCAWPVQEGPIVCDETDGAGEYLITPLPAIEYLVEFFPPWSTQYALQYWDHLDFWHEADTLQIVPGQTIEEIDAALNEGGRITGTVTDQATGAVLKGINVCALESFGTLYACTKTNAAGQYSLRRLASDDYKVLFSFDVNEFLEEEDILADGYETEYFDGVSTLAEAKPLAVEAPATVGGINASLVSSFPPVVVPAPPAPVPPAAIKSPQRKKPTKRCRAGFRKKVVKGKKRCVRIKRPKKHF